jgi:hypothetical protein
MSITALHIPHDESPMAPVAVNERDAGSYYPYVEGGPVEGGYLTIGGVQLVAYVNSRYAELDEAMVNSRATALFELAGAGMWGGAVRGDALLVYGAGDGDYERSLPPAIISMLLDADAAS